MPPEFPPAAEAAAVSRWPLRLQTQEGLITIYQPQLRDFDGNQLKGRAAVSVLAPGQQEPIFGAMWMESRVATDRVARTVQVLDTTVTKVRFPGPGGISAEALTDAMRTYRSQQAPVVLSLDQLLEMLQAAQQEKTAATDIETAPPKILFLDHPAVLVVYDGEPKLMQVENSPLIRAVNTPFFVVLDPPTKTYFLKGGSLWYAAPNPLGPFQPAPQVPPAVAALADSSGYQDPQAPAEGQSPPAGPVEIVTATEPTELVWTDGPEEMATVPNTNLLFVTNTPGDVFLLIDTQQIFVLLSGRWYVAANRNGPWAYVPPDKLPPDFARIPPQSEKGNVLASVAGTEQAKDAIADAYIPQTAAIDRQNFEQPPVQYDGDPQFVSAQQNSPVQYAVNTSSSVLLVDRRYYCCHNAVWYMAAAPLGPWQICVSVPAPIYTIPPTCPIYSVRYCYVYESTPTLVYVGYTPGYLGCYHFNHVVVHGTGFRYAPWVGRRYYPRPWTFGFAAHYNAYANHWGFNVAAARFGGDAWFARGAARTPGGAFFGHGGYRPVVIRNETRFTNVNVNVNVNLRGNRFESHADSLNLYQRRKDVRPAERGGPVNGRPGAAQPPRRVEAAPRGNERNNVFAGPNGEVYRKTIDGWEQRQNNRWEATRGPSGPAAADRGAPEPAREAPARTPPAREIPARETPSREAPARPAPSREAPARPAGPPAELNRDYNARIAGQQRARNYPPPSPAPTREAPRQPAGGQGGGAPGGGRSGGGGQGQGQPGGPKR
ncbi:MAG TPA: hypothetical protein VGI81_25615 [Tepidisphaeraceae bacterium]|jgi:hypothetical protein